MVDGNAAMPSTPPRLPRRDDLERLWRARIGAGSGIAPGAAGEAATGSRSRRLRHSSFGGGGSVRLRRFRPARDCVDDNDDGNSESARGSADVDADSLSDLFLCCGGGGDNGGGVVVPSIPRSPSSPQVGGSRTDNDRPEVEDALLLQFARLAAHDLLSWEWKQPPPSPSSSSSSSSSAAVPPVPFRRSRSSLAGAYPSSSASATDSPPSRPEGKRVVAKGWGADDAPTTRTRTRRRSSVSVGVVSSPGRSFRKNTQERRSVSSSSFSSSSGTLLGLFASAGGGQGASAAATTAGTSSWSDLFSAWAPAASAPDESAEATVGAPLSQDSQDGIGRGNDDTDQVVNSRNGVDIAVAVEPFAQSVTVTVTAAADGIASTGKHNSIANDNDDVEEKKDDAEILDGVECQSNDVDAERRHRSHRQCLDQSTLLLECCGVGNGRKKDDKSCYRDDTSSKNEVVDIVYSPSGAVELLSFPSSAVRSYAAGLMDDFADVDVNVDGNKVGSNELKKAVFHDACTNDDKGATADDGDDISSDGKKVCRMMDPEPFSCGNESLVLPNDPNRHSELHGTYSTYRCSSRDAHRVLDCLDVTLPLWHSSLSASPSYGIRRAIVSQSAFNEEFGKRHHRQSPESVCSEPLGSCFKIRGPSYASDGVKVPSEEAFFALLGVDSLSNGGTSGGKGDCTDPCRDFFRRWDETCGRAGVVTPFLLVINLVVPWGYLAAYFYRPGGKGGGPFGGNEVDCPAERAWEAFLRGNESYRNKRLKFIPKIICGPWIAVGSSPAIIGQKLPTSYYGSIEENYLEIRLDVTRGGAVANSICGTVAGRSDAVTVDLAFLVEGSTDGVDLPERALCAYRLHHVSVKGSVGLEQWREVVERRMAERRQSEDATGPY